MNPEMIRRLKKMQEELVAKQKQLEEQEFVIEKQGIKVTIKGNLTITSVKIDELLIDPEDPEILEDLVMIAINAAIDKVNEEKEKIMPQMPGGLGF